MSAKPLPWYRELNGYHWFVLLVAALGWMFDCLDQQLFVLARPAAMKDLVPAVEGETVAQRNTRRDEAGDLATSIFIAGWACGGLFFGMLGDRFGRAKTMLITILLYSAFTGLSSLSTGVWDFALYRFLTGLGVGGEFAVGVALVAEVMPAAARTYALATLQALSAVGNISAALINLRLGIAEEAGLPYSPWRIMFVIGALPALLTIFIRIWLKEPEAWLKMRHDNVMKKQMGSYAELFGNPLWRKHALLGLMLGFSGVVGLWSVGFFTPDLIRRVQRAEVYNQVIAERRAAAAENGTELAALQTLLDRENTPKSVVLPPLPEALAELSKSVEGAVSGRLSRLSSYTSIAINGGAFFGMFGFGALSQRIGRKKTFVLALLAAFVSTVSVFWFLKELWQIWVFVPIMGFCQLSLFAGYAIYFPELFPTRLRSTGTSFCYNVGRFIAALGPLVKSRLTAAFIDTPEPTRYAGVTMCLVFLVGLMALPFLPETKDKPLYE